MFFVTSTQFETIASAKSASSRISSDYACSYNIRLIILRVLQDYFIKIHKKTISMKYRSVSIWKKKFVPPQDTLKVCGVKNNLWKSSILFGHQKEKSRFKNFKNLSILTAKKWGWARSMNHPVYYLLIFV